MDAIRIANETGNLDLLRILLPIASKDFLEDGYLHAVYKGYLNVLDCYISQGVDIQVKDVFGKNAIRIAIRNFDKSMIAYLISHGIRIKKKCIIEAMFYYDVQLYDLLARSYISENGTTELLSDILQYDIDLPDPRFIGIIEYLIEPQKYGVSDDVHGADICQCNYKLFIYAVVNRYMHIVEKFFNGKQQLPVNILQYGLVNAIMVGSLRMVKYLVGRGADIHLPTKINSDTAIYEYLLSNVLKTPFDVAIERNNPKIIAYLKSMTDN